MEKVLEFFDIVGPWAGALLGAYLLLNLIGELCELKGKLVPEFMKIRKFFKRKRDEKKAQKDLLAKVSQQLEENKSQIEADKLQHEEDKAELAETKATLEDVKATLRDFNLHYSADNITQRNEWMERVNNAVRIVNDRTEWYDLTADITYKLYRDNARQRIFEFQRWLAAHPDTPATYEEFRQIRGVYDDYHQQLLLHDDRNGQIDSTWKAIEAEEQRRLSIPGLLVD